MTSQIPGWLASGHVTTRHTWPPRTSSGMQGEVAARRLVDRPENHAGDAERGRRAIVVLTSRVPMRNHGSLALRRSGTENEKRPAMGPNRILDILMVKRPPAGTIPDSPGSYQFKDAQGRVIYVGKASSLRQRLSNYFGDPRYLHPRTAQMVADGRVGRVDHGAQRGRGADARVLA